MDPQPTPAVPPECDYRRFGGVARVWGSVDAFCTGRWTPGVNVVRLGEGGHLDLFLEGDLQQVEHRTALPIFFSGAVSTRAGEPGPFLSGLRLGRQLGVPFVSVADPTLNHDSHLRLAWYTGRSGEGVQASIARVLDSIGTRTGRELLCIGGSGGGFAALHFASALRCPTSVMVWNPQTDLLDYSPNSVADWLSVVLKSSRRDVRALAPTQVVDLLRHGALSYRLELTPDDANPLRMVYLQNDEDSHVADHCLPFLGRASFTAQPEGRYADASGRVVWVGPLGRGHSPPAPLTLQRAITGMLDVGRTSSEVVDELRAHVVLGDASPPGRRTPRPRLSVVGPGRLEVDAGVVDARHYAFHLYRGSERVSHTTWRRSPLHQFVAPSSGDYRVRVHTLAKDGSKDAYPSRVVRVDPW